MIYWALRPFVRSFILPVDPGDICPPHMPPLAIKGEACNVTNQAQLRLSGSTLPQQSNTQWSRVLRSGDPNRSKSSRVHVLGDRLAG
jgi:hypothetical protein